MHQQGCTASPPRLYQQLKQRNLAGCTYSEQSVLDLSLIHIYFDGSINRIGAYIIGVRAAQKSLLQAFLEPLDTLRKYEDEGKLFQRLALLEEEKTLPFGAVYDYFNLKNNIPVGEEYIADIEKYEAEVLVKRV